MPGSAGEACNEPGAALSRDYVSAAYGTLVCYAIIRPDLA